MNLQEFTPGRRIAKGKYLRVGTSGSITTSKELMQELGLEEGTKIQFHQDKDSPKDWYFRIALQGMEIKPLSSTSVSFGIASSALRDKFKETYEITKKTPFVLHLGSITKYKDVIYYQLLFKGL